jgi:hypothetical protein
MAILNRIGPLVAAQEFEWWKTQHSGARAGNNIWVNISFDQPAKAADVVLAMQVEIERHEALRTSFDFAQDGSPIQIVKPPADIPFYIHELIDGESLEEFAQQLTNHEFSSNEPPLRVAMISADDLVGSVIIVVPHTVFDWHSGRILAQEMRNIIEARQQGQRPRRQASVQQPIDIANMEKRDGAESIEARTYWEKKFRIIPNRMFAPRGNETTAELVSGRLFSEKLASALSLAAMQENATPPIIYRAVMHALLSGISDIPVSVVKENFSGRRTKDMVSSVGCFHQILPTYIDLSDRPSLKTIISRTCRATLLTLYYSQIGYLCLREIMAEQGYLRGVIFADGTTINFMGADSSIRERDVHALRNRIIGARDSEISLGPLERIVDHWGIDAYLTVMPRSADLLIEASFNTAIFDEEQMSSLLEGPERVLMEFLQRGDLGFDEIADCARLSKANSGDVGLIDNSVFRAESIRAIILLLPGVVDALVVTDAEHGLLAFLACPARRIPPSEIRSFVLARIHPALGVICPRYFVVCAEAPSDRCDVAAWRRAPRIAEGPGTECPRQLPSEPSATEVLHRLVRSANSIVTVDMSRPYVLAGGRLNVVPFIIKLIDRAGYAGLVPDDFTRPVPLADLAAMLRPHENL